MLRYQEYSFTAEANVSELLRPRRLFVCVPMRRRKPNTVASPTREDESLTESYVDTPAIDKALVGLQRAVLEDVNDIPMDKVWDLLSDFGAEERLDPTRFCRPVTMAPGEHRRQCVFLEQKSGLRRRRSALARQKWLNAGGKNSLVILTTSADQNVERRSGFVQEPDESHFGESALKYFQYRLRSAYDDKPHEAISFHVFENANAL